MTKTTIGGLLLIVAFVAAIVVSNSPWAASYFDFFAYKLTVGFVTYDFRHWVNDAIMALFFLVVGLEIKHELINGELRSWRRAAFPVVAAIGGMVVPALLFLALNPSSPQISGWAIPMATDIAIAVGIIGLLGKRIPRSLRVFLLTLAVVDDIASIIVIALFYNLPTNMWALGIAAAIIFVMFAVRKMRYWPLAFIVLGIALLYCLLIAGVSGTIAGVIVALLVPMAVSKQAQRKPLLPDITDSILTPLSAFIIVPIFVFANAGIKFADITLTDNGSLSVLLGVFAGLLIGKPLGIFVFGWVADKTKIAQKPLTFSWRQLLGVGCLAGIGFTIAILIAGLAYRDSMVYQNAAIIGIFMASIVSGIVGVTILSSVSKIRKS